MVDRGASSTWAVENLLRPVLIAGMMVCLATPPVLALEWLLTGWNATYFLVFCFLAGLEGMLSERLLSRRQMTGREYYASRAAELVILLLLLKIINAVPGGLDQLWEGSAGWAADLGSFVTPVDGATWGMLVPLWIGALSVERRVSELDESDGLEGPPADRTSAAYYLWMSRPSLVRDREAVLLWLGERVLWGGVAMLVASAALFIALPDSRLPAVAVLMYFSLGVALLSQARFSVARAGWQAQGIRVERSIASRWLLWAVVFLVAVATMALILPTEYLMGPVLAVYSLMLLIGRLVIYVVSLLYYALSWLASRFRSNAEPPEPPTLALTPVPAGEAAPAGAAPSWSGFLFTLVFWFIILAIIGLALFRVLKDRLHLLQVSEGAAGKLWRRLMAWLVSLWHTIWLWRREVQTMLADRITRRGRGRVRAEVLPRFFSLRRLSPRNLVRYFYLSTARRASRAGQPREPGQTPYEYRSSLGRRFSELEPDLSGLTEAFVQARYSPRPVEKEDAERVRPLWQRIKAALQRRRLKGSEGEQ